MSLVILLGRFACVGPLLPLKYGDVLCRGRVVRLLHDLADVGHALGSPACAKPEHVGGAWLGRLRGWPLRFQKHRGYPQVAFRIAPA